MEETTHLKTATSVQRSLPVLGSWCAGEPGKMLRGASSKANDGQFVVMYKRKVQCCPLKKEESNKDSQHGHSLRRAANEIFNILIQCRPHYKWTHRNLHCQGSPHSYSEYM